uniref:Uncharacterized protein n=1 Tax=Kalanchoe fedtschenkoi TaxID=63787 RepID=A0A7N0UHH8_KALFE
MDTTQELRHGAADQQVVDDNPNPGITTSDDNDSSKTRRESSNRTALAKRGLKSLAVMLAVPVALNLAAISMFGSGQNYRSLTKWVPPLWPLHMLSLLTSLFMSLSAWLFWADGGFHKRPRAFYLYAAGILLNMLWDPLVLGFGASRLGLGVCVGMISALIGCYRHFSAVNPAAGHLVKPCFGLYGILALVNLRLACI